MKATLVSKGFQDPEPSFVVAVQEQHFFHCSKEMTFSSRSIAILYWLFPWQPFFLHSASKKPEDSIRFFYFNHVIIVIKYFQFVYLKSFFSFAFKHKILCKLLTCKERVIPTIFLSSSLVFLFLFTIQFLLWILFCWHVPNQ